MSLCRRTTLLLSSFLMVLCLVGCHSSPNGTQTANGAASPGPLADNANSSANSASPAGVAVQTVTIPAGTAIEVRLQNSLSSARNHGGDAFGATVAEPVLVNGWEVIPRGSDVTGRVVMARPSGRLKTSAELGITLASIQVNGESYDLRTSDVSRRAASHAKHDAKWIGGLAAGGALLGAVAGHGKGAGIGAGIGAGAGTATAYETGKKDIYLPSEQPLTFILREPLTVSRAG